MKYLFLYIYSAFTWALSLHEQAKEFSDHTQKVRYATFSHDGKMIATASYDKLVGIYDAESLEKLYEYQHNNPVVYAEFSLDDKLIITCTSIQNQCFLRKIKSNHIIHTFNEEDLIKKVIYTDEKIILVFSYYIKIYSSITYEVEHRIKLEPYENIQGSFLNTDNKLIIISYRFLTSINIYNGDIENRTTYRYEQQNFIKYFYCHNNDNVVFYDKHNFKLVIYNTLSLKYSYIDYKLNECITSIYMDQMHSIIIIAYNNCIDIIDLKNFNYIDRIKNDNNFIYCININSDLNKMITLSETKKPICYFFTQKLCKTIQVKNAYFL